MEATLCLLSLSLKYKPRAQPRRKQRPGNKPSLRDSTALHTQAQAKGRLARPTPPPSLD